MGRDMVISGWERDIGVGMGATGRMHGVVNAPGPIHLVEVGTARVR
jgi:hypothetical protein